MSWKEHKWVYIVIAVVLVALMVLGVARFRRGAETAAAHAKARQASALLARAGYPVFPEQVMVETFGTDGGAMADNPDNFFVEHYLTLQQSTAGVASRPLILGTRVFKAEEILLSVYAPDKLPAFNEYVASLKLNATLP